MGNRKSLDPRSPSNIPTIFPKIYRKKLNDPLQLSARYERAINREIIENQSINTDEVLRCVPLIVDQNNINTSVSICTQVAFDVPDDNFIFSCDFHGNSVNTQVSIPKSFHNFTKPTMVEKSCGLDFEPSTFCFSKISFHGYDSIKSENSLKDLTGTTFQIFNFFLTLLPQSNRLIISKENTLLICLMKLKLGLTYSSLSTFFSIHRTTVSRVFSECLLFLSQKCKHLIFWPSKNTITETLPEVFKKNYPNCRCIIDCTEIRAEQPKTVEQRVCMYSHYKGGYTIKVLVAITPNGMVSFLSKSYGGRSSDSYITNDSGFLNKLEPGDQVLADKGFPGIKTGVDGQNSILVIPPMLHNGRFTEEEVLSTYNVASVRIHIERLFARLKTFNVLNKITSDLLVYIDNILFMCCVLVNLSNPIIKQ